MPCQQASGARLLAKHKVSWVSAAQRNDLPSFHRFKHRGHFLVQQIDCLQRANHHLEFNDFVFRIPGDDVHAVYRNLIDDGLELEHRNVAFYHFLYVAEGVVSKHLDRGRQI